jgi:hypothetical protein
MYQMNPNNIATKSVVNDLIYSIYLSLDLCLYSSDNNPYTHTCTRKRNSSSLYSSDLYSSDSSDSVSVKTLYSIDS